MPDPATTPIPQQPAPTPVEPIITVEARRILDLPGRFGNGWTVAGENLRGQVVLTHPDGDGVRSLTISKDAYEKVKALRMNRARQKPPKRFFRLQQELLLPNSSLRVKADDVAGGKALVSGTVKGEYVQRWVDAKTVNRAVFNPTEAVASVFEELGVIAEPEKKEEKETKISAKPVGIEKKEIVEKVKVTEQEAEVEPSAQLIQPSTEEKTKKADEEEPAEETKKEEEEKKEDKPASVAGVGVVSQQAQGIEEESRAKIVKQKVIRLGGETPIGKMPTEASTQEFKPITESSGEDAEQAVATVKISAEEPPTPSSEISITLELYRQRQRERKSNATAPFLRKEIEELEQEIEKNRQVLQQKAKTVGIELLPDDNFLPQEFERAGLEGQKNALTQKVKRLERKAVGRFRPADEILSAEEDAEEQTRISTAKAELDVARKELDQFNKTNGERMEKISTVTGDGLRINEQVERLKHLKKRESGMAAQPPQAPVSQEKTMSGATQAAVLTALETPLAGEPPQTIPKQTAVGIPQMPSASRPKPAALASGWKRQRLITLGVSPETATAVEINAQREEDRMEDARTRALGSAGGLGEAAPLPSYAKQLGTSAAEDVPRSDLSDRARVEETQKQMQAAKQAFTGEPSPELVPPPAEAPEAIPDLPPPEGEAPQPEQDLLRLRAQEAQSRRIAAQREQLRLSAQQETGAASAARAKQLKHAWHAAKGGSGVSGIGLLITLAILNIQFFNKLTFKAKSIPPTDFPVEDGLVVCADCLSCIGCLLSMMVSVTIIFFLVKMLKFVIEHPYITWAAVQLNALFN